MPKPKLIETPEEMWALFEAYRKDVKDNPRKKIEYVGKDGDRVETPLERPLTQEGFKNYCFENVCDIQAYWLNRDGAYTQYSPIITRIREIIRQEQIEGGMVGQYQHTLTARLNGLVEKTENDHHHEGTVEITLNLNK